MNMCVYVHVHFGLLLLRKEFAFNSDVLSTLAVIVFSEQMHSAWHYVMPFFFHSWRSRSPSLSWLFTADHSQTIYFPVDQDREQESQAAECFWSHSEKRIALRRFLVTPCLFTPVNTPLECPTPFSTFYQESTRSLRIGTWTTSVT